LGQVLTTEGSAGGSGSRALGEVHSDVLRLRAKYSAKALAATLNTSLIRWIVDANYGNVDLYPRFEFVTEDPTDRKEEVEIINTLKSAGYKAKREWVEERIQIELDEPEPVPTALNGKPEEEREESEEKPEETPEEVEK